MTARPTCRCGSTGNINSPAVAIPRVRSSRAHPGPGLGPSLPLPWLCMGNVGADGSSYLASRAPLLPCPLQLEQNVLSRHLAWPRAPAVRYQRQGLARTGDRWTGGELGYLSSVPQALRPVRPRRCKPVCHCMTPRKSIASSWSRATRCAHGGPRPWHPRWGQPRWNPLLGATPRPPFAAGDGQPFKCSVHKYFT